MPRCTNCARHLIPNTADFVQLGQDVWQVTELFKLLRLVLPVGDIDVALARLLFERLGIDQPPLNLKVLLAHFLCAVVVFRVRPDADDVRTLQLTSRAITKLNAKIRAAREQVKARHSSPCPTDRTVQRKSDVGRESIIAQFHLEPRRRRQTL